MGQQMGVETPESNQFPVGQKTAMKSLMRDLTSIVKCLDADAADDPTRMNSARRGRVQKTGQLTAHVSAAEESQN